jgi:phospholipase C
VLDHTSLIRIIERRFGVREPNISAFRRRTCGDFTSALRFSGPPAGYPRSPQAITLAAAAARLLSAQQGVFANPTPLVPAANDAPMSRQGIRVPFSWSHFWDSEMDGERGILLGCGQDREGPLG